MTMREILNGNCKMGCRIFRKKLHKMYRKMICMVSRAGCRKMKYEGYRRMSQKN